MLDFLIEALNSPAGSVAQVTLIFVGFFVLVWKVSHFNTKYNDIEKTNAKIDNFEQKFQSKFDRIDDKSDGLKQDIMTIKSLLEVHFNNSNPMAQRQSPISLTDIGKEVIKEIRGEELISKHWEEIEKRINEDLKEDFNPYDIQVASLRVGDDFLNIFTEKEISDIKKSAFSRGYDLIIYELPIGILIRDTYMKKKNIRIEDIDIHDPNVGNQ